MTVTQSTLVASPDARGELSQFIRQQAAATEAELGFGWVASPTAPDTYQQLRGAFERSQLTHEPLAVSSLFSDNTVYEEPADNYRFRYWHDTHHVLLGLSFRLEDELELALWHLDQATAAGFEPGGEVYRLLQADLIGQLLLLAIIGRFPLQQITFVQTCHKIGLMPGLLAEIRRLG